MNAINSMKFMSPSTFVKWFFAWISAFQIHFRKEIDPWCEHSPRILACNGTHIGVATRKIGYDILTQIVTTLIEQILHKEVIRTLAKFFLMFCKDAAWSSAVPFKCHPLVHMLVRDVRLHNIVHSQMQEMKKYCHEMGDFLEASVDYGCLHLGASFCEHLVLKMELVHQCNMPVPDAQEIPNTYYPPGGTAYYFSESRGQVIFVCAHVNVHIFYLCKMSFVNTNVYYQSVFIGEENALLLDGQIKRRREKTEEEL